MMLRTALAATVLAALCAGRPAEARLRKALSQLSSTELEAKVKHINQLQNQQLHMGQGAPHSTAQTMRFAEAQAPGAGGPVPLQPVYGLANAPPMGGAPFGAAFGQAPAPFMAGNLGATPTPTMYFPPAAMHAAGIPYMNHLGYANSAPAFAVPPSATLAGLPAQYSHPMGAGPLGAGQIPQAAYPGMFNISVSGVPIAGGVFPQHLPLYQGPNLYGAHPAASPFVQKPVYFGVPHAPFYWSQAPPSSPIGSGYPSLLETQPLVPSPPPSMRPPTGLMAAPPQAAQGMRFSMQDPNDAFSQMHRSLIPQPHQSQSGTPPLNRVGSIDGLTGAQFMGMPDTAGAPRNAPRIF